MNPRKLRLKSPGIALAGAALLLISCSDDGAAQKPKQADAADAACVASERFATGVQDVAFGDGQAVGRDRFPELVFGPPEGGGCCQGSVTDVVSIGNGGTLTLTFDAVIVDGPGPDFIVFENAFWVNGDESLIFAELATVEVSADGTSFAAYPCVATAAPYGACAGWHPVYASSQADVDALDPSVAGGDAYDLADVGLASARFVRITDRADLMGTNGVFDLDAVGIVNAACP